MRHARPLQNYAGLRGGEVLNTPLSPFEVGEGS